MIQKLPKAKALNKHHSRINSILHGLAPAVWIQSPPPKTILAVVLASG
jgi:hypothetical protein